MLGSTALALFLAAWSTVYLADLYLRSTGSVWYGRLVQTTGLVVSPLQLRVYTGQFGPLLVWLCSWPALHGRRAQTAIGCWFTIGVIVAVACLLFMTLYLTFVFKVDRMLNSNRVVLTELPIVIGWLLRCVRHVCVSVGLLHTTAAPSVHLTHTSTQVATNSQLSLVPVVPGVNVPWSHIPVFLGSLVVTGVWHELGHALAAVHERVTVTGFGVFLFAVYPGAFTELDNDTLDARPPLRRLHIYCAGIWHNIVFALAAAAAVYAFSPAVSVAFLVDKGVLVTQVAEHSGLNGAAGIRPGDVVYGVNYCKVYNAESWHGCLQHVIKTNYGYCLPKGDVADGEVSPSEVHNLDGELECCGVNKTATHLCFYYKNSPAIANPLVPDVGAYNTTNAKLSKQQMTVGHACLAARHVTDHYICNYSLPCSQRAQCVYPALFNDTKLLRFFIANRTRPVLFIGHPRQVYAETRVSNYVPLYSWLSHVWPELAELFLKYTVTFSFALGLLNAVPCYSLDGQFMVGVLLELVGFRAGRRARRRRWSAYRLALNYGTAVLLCALAISMCRFTFGIT